MNNLIMKSYFFGAGLVMMLVGFTIGITTSEYSAVMTSATTTASIDMLSDLKGMGGMLLMLGSYVFISTFRRAWQHPALVIATAVYASFMLFRTLGFITDGLPGTMILVAYTIETVLAIMGAMIVKSRRIKGVRVT